MSGYVYTEEYCALGVSFSKAFWDNESQCLSLITIDGQTISIPKGFKFTVETPEGVILISSEVGWWESQMIKPDGASRPVD